MISLITLLLDELAELLAYSQENPASEVVAGGGGFGEFRCCAARQV